MPNKLSRFIQIFDIYSIGVQLNFKKQEKQKSFFGGIISMISFALIGYTFWFYCSLIIQRENPLVVQSVKEVIQSQRMNINKDNIVVMVGVQNQSSKSFVDRTVFNVTATFQELVYSVDQKTNKTTRQLVSSKRDIKQCTDGDVEKNKLKEYFSKFNYENYFCLDNKNDTQNYIEGGFDQEHFSQIYFYIRKCQNSTMPNSIVCKSHEEIDNILSSAKLSINFSDQLLYPSNLENPFIDKGINQYSQISSKFQKEIQILYQNSYVEDDIGYMMKDIVYQRGYSFSDLREVLITDTSDVVCRVLVRVKRSKENLMTRRYPRLFDAAAQVGGLIKVITMIGALVVRKFQRFEFHRRLVNEIFSFQTEQKTFTSLDKQDIYLNKEKTSLENSCNDGFRSPEKVGSKSPELAGNQLNRDRLNSFNRRDGNFMKQVQQIFRVTKDQMKYSFCNYLSHFLCPKAKQIEVKKPLLDYSIQKALENLDILYILNKLIEIDKLKYILFDEDQLKLFEFIPKPVITMYDAQQYTENSINQSIINNINTNLPKKKQPSISKKQQKMPKFFFQGDKTWEQKASDGQKSLIQIIQKTAKSVVDYKLLNAINPSLLNYNKGQQLHSTSKFSKNNLQVGDKQFNFSQIDVLQCNQIQEDESFCHKKLQVLTKDSYNLEDIIRQKSVTNMNITISPPLNYDISYQDSPYLNKSKEEKDNQNESKEENDNESEIKENDITSAFNKSMDDSKAQINKIKYNNEMFFDKLKDIKGQNRIEISQDSLYAKD